MFGIPDDCFSTSIIILGECSSKGLVFERPSEHLRLVKGWRLDHPPRENDFLVLIET